MTSNGARALATLPTRGVSLRVAAAAVASWLATTGCAGHEARTLRVRSALDANRPEQALVEIDKELDVKNGAPPKDATGDNALLVLDRGSIQQSLGKFDASKRDYQLADKAIDVLDLSRNAGDSIGEYLYSDSAGKYRAPPTERLLVNTLNLVNYLETGDTEGALVEARRFSVIAKYVREASDVELHARALGSVLCGLAYERAGQADEALRYYDDAIAVERVDILGAAVRRLLATSGYQSARLAALPAEAATRPRDEQDGDIVFVVGQGRVPHKVPKRVPIGLALTLFADAISPTDRAQANRLAAQGLVTWVNYPALADQTGDYDTPGAFVDGAPVSDFHTFDLGQDIRTEWASIEGRVAASAITRTVARALVGVGVQAAAGKQSALGAIASLAAQATLTSLDTPDTRSWETLPAVVSIARASVAPGNHHIELHARGRARKGTLSVPARSVTVASLFALR